MRQEPNNALIRLPYDNYRILHPDGTLMCFCSKKKSQWYLRNGLAESAGDNEIRLTFEPKGYGDPLDILIGRSNSCVVSGATENLTKHHVIPAQYRRHFPKMYKDKNSCDLVVLRRKEHDEYERLANDFKNRLFTDHIDAHYREINDAWSEAKSIYNCMSKYFDRLPSDRQVFMTMRLAGLREKWGFSDRVLKARYLNSHQDYNKIIVEKIGVVNLIVLWKLHFIKYGRPNNLPDWWKPNMLKIVNRGETDKKTELMSVDIANMPELMKLIMKYDLHDVAKLYF